MADERPDAIRSSYVNHGTVPAPPMDDPSLSDDAPPPVPERITIHWRGLLVVIGFVFLLAVVSRTLGALAASILTVVALLGLAGWVIVKRRSSIGSAADGMWWGGGGAGSECDVGGGGGAGGGDC